MGGSPPPTMIILRGGPPLRVLTRIHVFPAVSRPSMRIRVSSFPSSRDTILPIVSYPGLGTFLGQGLQGSPCEGVRWGGPWRGPRTAAWDVLPAAIMARSPPPAHSPCKPLALTAYCCGCCWSWQSDVTHGACLHGTASQRRNTLIYH